MASMFELGILLSLIDNASAPLRQFGNGLQQTAAMGGNAMQRLGAAMDHISMKMTAIGGASLALGAEVMHFAEKPIEAFEEMDSAMNDLAVASLDKTGKIGAGFDAIREKVMQIDARLPMTTAQVAEVGTALMNLGTTKEQLLGGALDAAANLSVVLKMPAEMAGEMTAKVREAYQLKGDELPQAADLIQRISFAGGIKPGEQLEFMKYSAANINALGLTGLGNAKAIGALQVALGRYGIASSQAGTEIGGMLLDLSQGPRKLLMASKGMRGVAGEELKKAGLGSVSFFDDKGMLKGAANGTAIQQMVGTLADMRSKLFKSGGDRAVLDVFSGMFGAEHARAANLLAKNGVAGYTDSLKRLDDQASIDQRIGVTMQSLKNRLTVLSSNITNALGTIAAPAMEWLEPYIDRLANSVAELREWSKAHQTLSKWIMIVVGGLGLTLTTLGSVLLTAGLLMKVLGAPIGLIGRGFSLAATGVRALAPALGAVTGAFRAFAVAVAIQGGGLRGMLSVLAMGVRSLGAAMLGSPVGLAIAGIAVAALLVYKYWQPIKAFMGGVFAGVMGVLRPVIVELKNSFAQLYPVVKPVWDAIVAGVSAVVRWFGQLFTPMHATATQLSGMASAGRVFGAALGWVIRAVLFPFTGTVKLVGYAIGELRQAFSGGLGGMLKFLVSWSPFGILYRIITDALRKLGTDLPKRFADFGGNLVDGLVRGIGNRLSGAKNAITNFAGSIKDWFANKLGIHSPSRVFMGFGENIGQGAEIGIMNRLASTRDAATRLASSAIEGMRPALGTVPGAPVPALHVAAAATRARPAAVEKALAIAQRPVPAGAADSGAQRTAANAQPGLVVHFSPTVHVGAGGDVGGQVTNALKTSFAEFEKMMDRYLASRRRVGFGS